MERPDAAKRVGIVCEDWKAPYFRKMLRYWDYTYSTHPGLRKGTKTILVMTDSIAELQGRINEVMEECRKVKR